MAEKVNLHCDGVVFNNSFNKNKIDGHHHHASTSAAAAAASAHHNSSQSTPSSSSQHPVDRLKILYPNVNENETPLPRSWSSHDKCHAIGLSQNNLRVQYKGAGKSHSDAASVRTAHPIPAACGLYYFEVKIISKGKNGYMGIGLTSQNFKMNRLPGWDKQSYGYHGDDGNSFCSSGNGQPYGPTFTTGDIIGCGVNLVNNTCFYTKNGLDLGIAFRDLPSKLYPTVGLQTPGEEVDANFGQEPFKFDQIEDMIKQMRAETKAAIYNFPMPSDQGDSTVLLHKMVSSYLVHNGYSSTAETFAKTTGQNFSEEISSIKNRQKILKLVMSGRMSQAIEHTIRSYPGLLENNKNLLFMLKCRQFIEMVNGSDLEVPTSPSTSTTTNNNTNNTNLTTTVTTATTATNTNNSNNNNNNNDNDNDITNTNTNNTTITTPAKTSPVQTSVIQSTKSYQNGGTTQNNTVIDDCNVQDNQEIKNSELSNNGIESTKINDIELKDGVNNMTNDYMNDVEMENGHLPNGNSFKNGTSENNFTNSVDTDEDMDVDVAAAPSTSASALATATASTSTSARKYSSGFERILEFGRELSQMSQQLEKENKMNDDDRQMLEDAFSLIAYSNPWASPLGWQLCPSKRESVCAALNSAILESMNYSWRPPLEICVAHAYELLRLMANSSLGSCAFVSIEDIFSQN